MAVAAVPVAAALLAIDIAETVLVQIVGQLVSNVIQATLAPDLLAVQQLSFEIAPFKAIDPAIAIDAWVKGHLTEDQAKHEVRQYGYADNAARAMYDVAGEPPPPDFLSDAFHRGFLALEGLGPDAVTWQQGIYESRLKNKWWPLIQKMQYRLPDPGALIESRLRGYINVKDYFDRMFKGGFDADAAQVMLQAAGVPLSPQEGYDAYHRGLVPLDDPNPDTPSLSQIFRESRIADKYLPVFLALGEYLPPPRTVTALLRAGSISQVTALDLFKKQGLDAELAAAYVADASNQKAQGTKDLAKTDIVNLYAAKEITAQQAHDMLAPLGYADQQIALELGYADFKVVEASVSAGISRLRTLYTGHKVGKDVTVSTLGTLGLGTEAVNALLKVWDEEARANPSLLTAVQIADLAAQRWLPPADALNELQGRGYDERDAFALLILHKVDVSALPVPAGLNSPGQ